MKALVTGGHGFLGRPLVARLRAEFGDAAVRAPGRAEMDAGFEDLLDTLRPDVVWHLAGRLNGTEQELKRDNERSAARLFAALGARSQETRVVLASSAAVYGRGGTREVPLEESDEPSPRGLYAETKFAAEEHAHAFARAGGHVVVARISNPVGVGMGDHLLCGTVASQIAAIERGAAEAVLNLRDLTPLRDFVHADDVADALRHLADRGAPGEAYHVASGRSISARAMVDLFVTAARVHPIDVRSTVQEASRSPMQEQWLRIAKIEATGWSPARDVRAAVGALLESRRSAVAARPVP